MVFVSDHDNAIFVDRLPSKTKIGKDSWKRFRKKNLFYVSPSSPQLKRRLFLLKTQKTTSSASVWWGNTKSIFKEITTTFVRSSSTQENIRNSKLKRRL